MFVLCTLHQITILWFEASKAKYYCGISLSITWNNLHPIDFYKRRIFSKGSQDFHNLDAISYIQNNSIEMQNNIRQDFKGGHNIA